MKNSIVIAIFVIFAGCKTYEKSTVLDTWYDKWNVKHRSIVTHTYLRHNDSLVRIKYDTLSFEPTTGNVAIDFFK